MMISRWIARLAAIALFTVSTGPLTAQDSCPDSLPSRLAVGDLGQVTPGGSNNVRDLPATSGARTAVIPPGTVFRVLDGVTCAEGYAWWQIETLDGTVTGWTVEAVGDDYAVQPYTPTAPDLPSGWERIEKGGASIGVDPDIGLTVTGVFNEGADPANVFEDERWLAQPASVEFQFDNDDDPTNGYKGYIEIFPAAAYSAINPGMGEDLDTLRETIAARPELTDASLDAVNFSLFTTAVARSRGTYIETDSLVGVRFIGHYSQDASSLPGGWVSYVFEGMTRDGLYYVSARFSLFEPFLPYADEYPASLIDPATGQPKGPGQIEYLVTHLNDLPADAFSPALETLDAMIASVFVETGAFAAYEAAVAAVSDAP